MTQVQTMTNQELNRKLAELMGYTITQLPIGANGRQLYALVTPLGRERLPALTIDNAYLDAPDYCNDPAASLAVQTAAIEKDYKAYVHNLNTVLYGEREDDGEYSAVSVEVTAAMLTSTHRERAEAAYITLQATLGNNHDDNR